MKSKIQVFLIVLLSHMQFNKRVIKSVSVLVVSFTLFSTACKKETVKVAEHSSFSMDIPGDTLEEFVPLHFTNTAAEDCKFLWDFGNGTASTERNPTAYYPVHGTYIISLQVTNSQGISSVYSHQLVILCKFYKQLHKGELL